MSFKNTAISTAVAASLVVGSVIPMSSAAFADSWGGRHEYRHGGDRDWATKGDRRFRGFEQYRRSGSDWRDYRRYHDDRAERREDRRDRKLARGVAIGLGVLMLGAILSQANAQEHRYDDRYDY